MPTRDHYEHGTPSWIDLMSPDVDGSKRFYGELFGWTFEDQPAGEQGTYVMCSRNGRHVAGLSQLDPSSGMPPMWNSYVTVEALEATVKEAEANGGSVMAPPMDVMDAGRMAVVADPAQGALALWEPRNHPGAGLVNEHGALIWNELLSTDLPAATEFWTATLGWKADAMEMPDGPYTVFMNGENAIAGAMASPLPDAPSFWAIYLATDDCAATVARAKDMGASVVMEPNEVPDVGVLSTITDPQGVYVSVMTPAST